MVRRHGPNLISSRSIFLFEHDLFGKPVPTFPDHALMFRNTGSPAGACHRAAIRPTRWRAMTTEGVACSYYQTRLRDPATRSARVVQEIFRHLEGVGTVALRISGASQPGWAAAPPQDLTPASGRQDHTTSPYATTSFVSAPFDRSQILVRPALHHVSRLTLPRPPHPHPASVTIAIRPSGEVGCEKF